MSKHHVEIFVAGCPLCHEVVLKAQAYTTPETSLSICDLNDDAHLERARALGIFRAPTIVVDGEVLSCCESKPIQWQLLKEKLQ